MNYLKKGATLTLFLSLIASFVLYRADVFKFENTEDTPKLVVSNVTFPKDALNNDKRLIVDYVLNLTIDTTYVAVERKVIKTFTLETWDSKSVSRDMSSTKNSEQSWFTSKNKTIIEKLKTHQIKRTRFTNNMVFDANPNDSDLSEVIRLLENGILKSNSSLEQHINNKEITDFYWTRYKNYKIQVTHLNNEDGILVDRKKVDEFLDVFREIEKIKVKKRSDIMSGSKSIQVFIDTKEIENPTYGYITLKKIFKEFAEQHLGTKF